jgi:hypothetical protein
MALEFFPATGRWQDSAIVSNRRAEIKWGNHGQVHRIPHHALGMSITPFPRLNCVYMPQVNPYA